MKSIVKTTLTLSLLLTLPGCWNFSSSKNNQSCCEKTHGHEERPVSKCSHKGCTHDHNKDTHTKSHELEELTPSTDNDIEELEDINDEDIDDLDSQDDEEDND